MKSDIKNLSLAPSGEDKIKWVEANMPLLRGLYKEFSDKKPLKGINIALSVHMEAKTAYFCRLLAAGGATVLATGCNPLSTQDDVAAALSKSGVTVFARHGVNASEYEEHLIKTLSGSPNIIIDDGGDLVHLLHTKLRDKLPGIIGGCEETTTGVHRLRNLEASGKLEFPMVLVNNADCKHLFDNRYGTGQSVWNGINRTTNLIVAGKTVVVSGYGWCGKGVSMRAKGLGAKVIVTEVDAVRGIEAAMDGFSVLPMEKAASLGDMFITVTGCKDVIRKEHFACMKNGALLANAGHFDVEIDVRALERESEEKRAIKPGITGYRQKNGRWLYLLAEGRLVNLAAGDGHPAEIMDMSFAIQALSVKYLVENSGRLKGKLIDVPKEIDKEVARRALAFFGGECDTLTGEQENYLNGMY